ncbi:MAG: CrcB family protein [Salinibacterium sp.]|nr:CrcB family protein [Salinibacterium sp.]
MSFGRELGAVLVGGAIGTGVRLTIDAVIPHGNTDFPFSTLAVNVVGAFLLGALVARLWEIAPSWLKAGLGAGLLGSFTTFSAFAVSLVSLSEAGEWGAAVGYLVLTVGLGLLAAWLGLSLGRRVPVNPDVDE